MTIPLWVTELADAFWAAAGAPEPAPRALRRPIAHALPVTVALLPQPSVAVVDAWLRRHGIPHDLAVSDRPLRACLVARRGHGIIFLDGADDDDEQRFSLAHEVAHFLRHYWQPRQEAVARLGPGVLPVLDGVRPPRREEQAQAIVARVPLGYHVHLMDRAADSGATPVAIDAAEQDADLLAYELLAPSAHLLAAVAGQLAEERRQAITRLLTEVYRLPVAPADRYAALLAPAERPAGSFLRRLGLAP